MNIDNTRNPNDDGVVQLSNGDVMYFDRQKMQAHIDIENVVIGVLTNLIQHRVTFDDAVKKLVDLAKKS